MTGLSIDVADLLTHPGARRALALEAELSDLHGSSARVLGPVRLDLVLERIPDGLLARGSAAGAWAARCSEGLEDLEIAFDLAFDELFEDEPVEGETYPITDRVIDLTQLVRDTVMLELPLAPRCGAGHPELRSRLGTDAEADERAEEPDPRWRALSQLEFPDAARSDTALSDTVSKE